MQYLEKDKIYCGEAEILMQQIKPDSIAVSVWSPPYHVGKNYESDQSYEEWLTMLETVIKLHYTVLKPGGFLAINIGDILCFPDVNMPRIQANNVSMRKCSITEEDVLRAQAEHPDYNRHQLAKLLGCSEQTVDRRLHGNNIRGGKYNTQTRVKIVGGLLEEMALSAACTLMIEGFGLRMLRGQTATGPQIRTELLTNLSICIYSGNRALLKLIGIVFLEKNGLNGAAVLYGIFVLFSEMMITKQNSHSSFPAEQLSFSLMKGTLFWIVSWVAEHLL